MDGVGCECELRNINVCKNATLENTDATSLKIRIFAEKKREPQWQR